MLYFSSEIFLLSFNTNQLLQRQPVIVLSVGGFPQQLLLREDLMYESISDLFLHFLLAFWFLYRFCFHLGFASI